jgi:hypothetical protein
MSSAMAMASALEPAASPYCVLQPKRFMRTLPWYSWMFRAREGMAVLTEAYEKR